MSLPDSILTPVAETTFPAAATPKPQPPRKPEPNECCGTGCIPCVMDIYEEELWEYERALKRWEAESQGQEDKQ